MIRPFIYGQMFIYGVCIPLPKAVYVYAAGGNEVEDFPLVGQKGGLLDDGSKGHRLNSTRLFPNHFLFLID